MSDTPDLSLDAVRVERGGRALFAPVSLRLGGGELLRVTGANGAGKTSLLRLMAGLLPPAAGRVCWRGAPLAEQRERFARDRLFLGHEPGLKDGLDPTDNLLAATRLAGHPVAPAQAAQALAEAGLAPLRRVPVGRLSQGQRRRAALARLALARTQPLWVLDEPFNALDAAATGWLHGLLRAHLARGGCAVVTSHWPLALDGVAARELAL